MTDEGNPMSSRHQAAGQPAGDQDPGSGWSLPSGENLIRFAAGVGLAAGQLLPPGGPGMDVPVETQPDPLERVEAQPEAGGDPGTQPGAEWLKAKEVREWIADF